MREGGVICLLQVQLEQFAAVLLRLLIELAQELDGVEHALPLVTRVIRRHVGERWHPRLRRLHGGRLGVRWTLNARAGRQLKKPGLRQGSRGGRGGRGVVARRLLLGLGERRRLGQRLEHRVGAQPHLVELEALDPGVDEVVRRDGDVGERGRRGFRVPRLAMRRGFLLGELVLAQHVVPLAHVAQLAVERAGERLLRLQLLRHLRLEVRGVQLHDLQLHRLQLQLVLRARLGGGVVDEVLERLAKRRAVLRHLRLHAPRRVAESSACA
mmetsp:Transcript_41625/g.103454  ORF Transcript_41625/g.103454 Transcript_41625/m.103454 type:complete len:269 (-) Transcript_41625:219-1025(-)